MIFSDKHIRIKIQRNHDLKTVEIIFDLVDLIFSSDRFKIPK